MENLSWMKQVMLGVSLVALVEVSQASGAAPDPSRLIAGPANATITIEEFSDFRCPYCARGEKVIEKVLRNYPNDVNLIFRNVPLAGHQPLAGEAAKAFSAVLLQSPSQAYAFQKAIFDGQDELNSLGEAFLFSTATSLGIDVNRMRSDMDGPVVAKMIADDVQAFNAHGFRGTPSYMIGTESLVGAYPYRKFKEIIESQLGH